MIDSIHAPHSTPPEGVVSGDSIPRENELTDREERVITEAVGILKTHPAYEGQSDDELREIAKEKLL